MTDLHAHAVKSGRSDYAILQNCNKLLHTQDYMLYNIDGS